MILKHLRNLAMLAVIATPGHAATIGATSVTSPSGDFGGSFALVNAINQSGLSAGYTNGVTDFAAYTASTTHSSPGSVNSGFTNSPTGGGADPSQVFSFDLGSIISVDAIAVWANSNVGSIRAYDLYADTDQDSTNGVGALLGSFLVSGPATVSSASLGFFSATATQYLHMVHTSPQNLTIGIGEVVFNSTTPVPVPGALPLLLGGLAGLGLMRRRRQQQV